jgi:hypothetical protein
MGVIDCGLSRQDLVARAKGGRKMANLIPIAADARAVQGGESIGPVQASFQ